VVLQEQQQEAEALEKAGRIMRNVKLAAAWRGWLAVVDQRHHLKAKLGSALNLFVNRRLTLAWQAWKVNLRQKCGLDCTSCGLPLQLECYSKSLNAVKAAVAYAPTSSE